MYPYVRLRDSEILRDAFDSLCQIYVERQLGVAEYNPKINPKHPRCILA